MKKSEASIRVIGSGEAFDFGIGNTSYLFRGKGLPEVLFDCGYQIPERLWKEGLHTGLDAICLTHLHADHSFGIVPLLVRFWEEGRTTSFRIFGPRGTERFVTRLLELGYPGFSKRLKFRLDYFELTPETPIRFRGLKLSCARTQHSVLNYTIRVDLLRPHSGSFAVSGDGQITAQSKKLVDSVDVLFQEIYALKPEVPVHADLETVAAWVEKSQVGKVVASHFSRRMSEKLTQQVKRLARRRTQWVVSRPGLEISLLAKAHKSG